MTDKYTLPFALSAATLLVACLVATKNNAYAAEAEEPAVLQFATTYAEQRNPEEIPRFAKPAPPLAPAPVRQKEVVKPRPKEAHRPAYRPDRGHLASLEQAIAEKDQKISKKDNSINQLEKQIAVLQQSIAALQQPAAVEETSHFNPADKQAMLEMVNDLRQLFSFTPSQNTLADKLAQVENQLKEAQLAETTLRNQLKSDSNSKEKSVSLNARVTELQQQVAQYQQQIAQLDEHLAIKGKEAEKAFAERDNIQSALLALTAKNDSEQQKFAEKKLQIQELTEKLDAAQLAETALRNQLKTSSDDKDKTGAASARLSELQQQVAQYQQQIAQLDEHLTAKGKDVDQITAERNSLQSALQALTTKNDSEQKKFAEEKQQLANKIKESHATDEQQEAMKQQLQQLKEKLGAAQLTETTLQNQLKAISGDKDKAGAVSAHVTELQHQVAQYQQQITRLGDSLAAKGKDVDQITAEKNSLQSALQALTTKNDSEQKKFAEEKQQLANKIKESHATDEQQEAMKQQLQQLKEKLGAAQLTETTLQNQLKAISGDKDKAGAVSAHVTELQHQVAQYQQQITRLGDSLAAKGKDVDQITAEKNSLQSALQALTTKNDSEQKKLAEEKQQLANKIKESHATDEQQLQALKAKLNDAQQLKTMLEKEKAELAAQLTARPTPDQLAESQLMAKSLQAQLDQIQLKDAAKPAETSTADKHATQSVSASDDKARELQEKLDSTLAKLAAAEKQNKEEKASKSLPALTPDKLNKKDNREAYAIGMSLGDEILQMQAENRNWGTATDQHVVLAGIVDAFQGQAKLSSDVIRNTLKEVSQRVQKDQKTLVTSLDKATKQYLQRFTKMKDTHKSPSGFWYNINYLGDTPLPKNAMLDVVVKESLTNGDVITDMDTNGAVLTQPLSDYPPVFREALSKLKNHGSITIVVPPNLAYKDKGMPPKIPPNATMVYNLRIADSYPNPK